jgi:hypothetical protein
MLKEMKDPAVTQDREAQKEVKDPAVIQELRVQKEEEIQSIFQEPSAPKEANAPIVFPGMKVPTGENILTEETLALAGTTIDQIILPTAKTIVSQGRKKSGMTAVRKEIREEMRTDLIRTAI